MYRGLGVGSCLCVLGVAEKLHVWRGGCTGERGREPNRVSEGLSRGFGFPFECGGVFRTSSNESHGWFTLPAMALSIVISTMCQEPLESLSE